MCLCVHAHVPASVQVRMHACECARECGTGQVWVWRCDWVEGMLGGHRFLVIGLLARSQTGDDADSQLVRRRLLCVHLCVCVSVETMAAPSYATLNTILNGGV